MKYIGQRIPVVDAYEKVTGKLPYGDDIRFPDMLYGKILTSPVAHGKIKSMDCEKAKSLPGVHAVITYEDAPEVLYNRIIRWARDGLPRTERVLDRVVRYVGDKVAAVAAETEEIARKAVQMIQVEYEALPAVFDPEEALKEDAYPLYPEGNLLKELKMECGNVDEVWQEADFLVENAVSTPMIHHGAIEPHVCIASWAGNGELDIWGPQQGVHRAQIMLGQIFGLPCAKVHVHGANIGGTFGGKDGMMIEPVVALLSRKTGRPVKIRYTRKECIASTYTRHGVKLYSKMGVDGAGKIQGFEMVSYMNAGPHCGGSINVQSAMGGKMFKMYQAPHMRFHSFAAYTNTPLGGAMRGFGSPKVFTALELLVNKAAKTLQMDPVDFRLLNLVEPYEKDPASRLDLGNARVRDCLLSGREKFRWNRKKKEQAGRQTERYCYGYGVATAMHGNGVAPFAPDITVAELMLHEDGSVLLRTGLCDHGAGTYTLVKQIVAEMLAMPLAEVEITHSDTHSCPYDMGSGASRNTWSGGAAVEAAARKMKETLHRVACAAFGCEAKDVKWQDGYAVFAKTGEKLSRSDLVCYAYSAQKRKLIETVSYNSETNAGSYGAHFAGVQVDKITGEVKVAEYLAVCDVGKPLNPLLLEGQLEGAVAMGLGMALFEEVRLNEKGAVINGSFKSYRMPKAGDMPKIEIHFLDSFEAGGPYGGKSVGEASIVPVVPAIVGAVNDALGCELTHLPLLPEKILAALKQKEMDKKE